MKAGKTFTVPFAAIPVILLILVPVFAIMTTDRLKRQEDLFARNFLEKGISLIRTFEAGTRTGMLNMRWGAMRIQMLLTETSLQPDVAYMMIIDRGGKILAHSNPEQVGNIYENMPDTSGLKQGSGMFHHRVLSNNKSGETFEVVKRFEPVYGRMGPRPDRMHKMRAMQEEHGHFKRPHPDADWSRPHWSPRQRKGNSGADHYMIAGLSMTSAKTARDKLVRETVFQGVVYFMLAFAGMAAVFIFQAYRTTKASLTSIKAYSDTVIQNMPSGLLTLGENGDVTAMNESAKKILGKDISFLKPTLRELASEIKSKKNVVSREIQIEKEPGKDILLDLTASGIQENDGSITGSVFLFKDLTQVKELKQQVETNKRLAAIGKLAAGVAHEIRNPLSSIKGFATYFGRRYQDSKADSETAQIMVKEVERINRAVTQLLEFAKPMPVNRSDIDLKAVIDHSLKLVAQDLSAGQIEASVDINIEQPTVCTDGDRLNQVLLNLYMNALQAMDPGGHLDIRVTQRERTFVTIEVCDDGYGMDGGLLDRIFDPYFTTKPTGTGLGLSIVHRIMENLNGSIRVKSSPRQGTCFQLNLPAGGNDNE